MALHRHLPQATVDAVDINPEALDLAQCYFGAEEDAHLLMHHDDGVKFLTRRGVASKVCPASAYPEMRSVVEHSRQWSSGSETAAKNTRKAASRIVVVNILDNFKLQHTHTHTHL